jgi:hypothetical protein
VVFYDFTALNDISIVFKLYCYTFVQKVDFSVRCCRNIVLQSFQLCKSFFIFYKVEVRFHKYSSSCRPVSERLGNDLQVARCPQAGERFVAP